MLVHTNSVQESRSTFKIFYLQSKYPYFNRAYVVSSSFGCLYLYVFNVFKWEFGYIYCFNQALFWKYVSTTWRMIISTMDEKIIQPRINFFVKILSNSKIFFLHASSLYMIYYRYKKEERTKTKEEVGGGKIQGATKNCLKIQIIGHQVKRKWNLLKVAFIDLYALKG